MEVIDVKINKDGTMEFDLGGDLDGECCGNVQREIHERLKALGIELQVQNVFCRLPKPEMRSMQEQGQCVATRDTQDPKQEF